MSKGRSQSRKSNADQYEDSLDGTFKSPAPRGEIKQEVPSLKNLARPQTATQERVSRRVMAPSMNATVGATGGAREASAEQQRLAVKQARAQQLRLVQMEEEKEEAEQKLK